MDLNAEIVKINKDLASRGVKLRLERRGNFLNLRGPLPSKILASSQKIQRISLKIKATLNGLKEAQRLLELVLLQLEKNQFSWSYWAETKSSPVLKAHKEVTKKAISSFKQEFFKDSFNKRSLPGSKTTWESAYLPYLRRLLKLNKEKSGNLDINLLIKTLESYEEKSRSRQQCATVLSAFANHLEINLPEDWRVQASGYGLHKAHFRELPSDNLIKEIWKKIPNTKWQFAYGLMATYGLRNHEVFFCDLSALKNDGDRVLRVFPKTKTGEHQVWPFHPEWVSYFKLDEINDIDNKLPNINTNLENTTLQNVGRRVTEQFNRYGLSITPYDLRHAWAIRTIHIGLPDTVAARMMGHSVSIHTKTYHHWITRRDQQQAVDAALSKKIG